MKSCEMSTRPVTSTAHQTDADSATRAIAEFVHTCTWDDLPEATRHASLRSFVNWVGCAMGGASHLSVSRALAGLAPLSASQDCTVIGHDYRCDPLNAALLNGLSASAYAFDDTHLASIAHPTAPTVAALLAYAEQHPVSGRDFLVALTLSNEVQCRLSAALGVAPADSHLGLYMTGMTGAAGVAAGIGKLMGLSEQQLVWAIGMGAMQGSGFRATHGSMCGGIVPAIAGKAGLLAAHLAQADFTCSDDGLAARNGFLDVFARHANLAALTAALGTEFECMNVVAKPFPAGVLLHAAIDACLSLRSAYRFAPHEIETISVQVHRLALKITGKQAPRHAYDAQVSLFHWVAAVLTHARAGIHEASDACVHEPEVIALRQRIHAEVAPDLQADEARVSVTLRNGQQFSAEARPCLGSPGRPMSDAQLEEKLIAQAATRVADAEARMLAQHCWALPEAAFVRDAAPGFWGKR